MDVPLIFAGVLLLIIVIFVVLPNFVRQKPASRTQTLGSRAQTSNAPSTSTTPCREPTVAQISLAQEEERCMDRDMLKSFYPPPLTEVTPVDYPRRAIGTCPYAKPQSHELPSANVPMYILA